MSVDEAIKSGVEVLRIAAWPAVVLWVAWYLRYEMKRVVTRITELGFTGAKFAPPEQVATPPRDAVATVVSSSAPTRSAQQYIEGVKQLIPADQLDPAMKSITENLSSIVGSDQVASIEVLRYTVAALQISLAHERSYRMIYGSQLQLMAQMNADIGVPPNAARAVYDTAKTAWPDAYTSYSFEQWMQFLQTTGLVTVAPSGNYVLTAFGRGFLKYILDQHLSVFKPF